MGAFGPPLFLGDENAWVVRVMGRSIGALHSFLGLTLGALIVLLAFGMTWTATAQDYIPRGSPIPQSIRWTNATPTGVGTRASASWTFGGTTSHHSFPVPVSSSTVGKLAGAAIRRGLPVVGWGLVLRDIVNGAGWAIDELQQQVIVPGTPQQPLGSEAWCVSGGGSLPFTGMRCTSSKSDVGAMFGRVTGFQVASEVDQGNSVRINFYWPGMSYTNAVIATKVVMSTWDPTANANPYSDDAAVPFHDLGQALKDHPDVVNAILIDPETGAPIRTQELVDALNNLRQQLEAANGVTTPAPDIEASTDFADSTPSESAWPGFCDWATTVCEFIGWVKADDVPSDKPEVPWEDELPTPSTWTSGLGGGSCPAPVQFTVTLGGYSSSPEFRYDGICGFATIMRPVLIAAATIVAALIVAGIRSAKDA